MITPTDFSQNVHIGSIAGKLYQHTHNESVHITQKEKELLNSLSSSDSTNTMSDENTTLEDIQIQLNNKANISDIPTKVSQLENDMNFLTEIPDHYITESELEIKLSLIQDPPTKLSQLQNDTNFVTEDEVKQIVDETETQDVENYKLINSIDFSELDSLGNTYQVQVDRPKYYVVTTNTSHGTVVIGTLKMFSDDSLHVLVQILDTQYIVGADGNLTLGSHRDNEVYTYIRMFNFNAPGLSGQDPFTWTKWRLKDYYSGQIAFMGIANLSTTPVADVLPGRPVCYIACTPGTYTNFDSDITLQSGETALLIGNWSVSGGTLWNKTTIAQS